MSALLVATLCTLCFTVGMRGWWMTRYAGPRERLARGGAAREAPVRTPLTTRMLEGTYRRLAGPALRLMTDKQRSKIRGRLDSAGHPGGMTLADFAGRKATLVAAAAAAGLMFALRGNLLLLPALLVAAWMWHDLWLLRKARQRQGQIDRDLPDFLDVVAITVGAGVAFRPALVRVSAAIGGPIEQEVRITLQQMDIGASRRAAFGELRSRNSSESLTQFVTALLQAEELGTPLAHALNELAREMRRTFHQNARRRAARAAPRVSLIVTMLIVPASLVLILTSLFLGSNIHLGRVIGASR